jgi:hypothetical protein
MRTSQPNITNSSALAGAQGMSRGGGLGSATGQRLPTPPRERKPLLAALAVLLILGGALASAYLVMASGQRVQAIRLTTDIAAGQQIPASAMEPVDISNTGVQFINWSARGQVAQAHAAVPLVKGSLLTNNMLASTGSSNAGRAIVGLSLKPGQVPSDGLSDGQHLALFGLAGQDTGIRPGELLAEDAIVVGSTGPGPSNGNTTVPLSVSVPVSEVQAVVVASAAGQLGVALLPAGTRIDRSGQTTSPTQPSSPTSNAPSNTPTAPTSGRSGSTKPNTQKTP